MCTVSPRVKCRGERLLILEGKCSPGERMRTPYSLPGVRGIIVLSAVAGKQVCWPHGERRKQHGPVFIGYLNA